MAVTPLEVGSVAHGGRGLGRTDGRVVFIDGAVPGDLVEVDVVDTKKRFSHAVVTEVIRPSPDRVEAPCPVFGRCGGCDWQMMSLESQRRWKADILAGQLAHLGGVEHPPVADTVAVGPGFGYRNRIDLRISQGRPALLAARSHQPVEVEDCPLVVGPISAMIDDLAPGPDVDRVTLRASILTGEVAEMQRRSGRWDRAVMHEIVAGRRFQVTGRAFFQVNTAGAEMLVGLVSAALDVGEGDTLLDGYAGGGLFAATVGAAAGEVVAVESDRVALRDLAVNAPDARIVARPFESARLRRVDVAVVDPPRAGLGRGAVGVLVASHPRSIAYVSCDPASLARDTAILRQSGYRLEGATPVDMFPQTHHVEAVAHFSAD